jgi:hypothetical protein
MRAHTTKIDNRLKSMCKDAKVHSTEQRENNDLQQKFLDTQRSWETQPLMKSEFPIAFVTS